MLMSRARARVPTSCTAISIVRWPATFSSLMALVALVVAGCGGGPRLVLKQPIVNKCTEAGLRGCPDITEGAMLYAEGKQAEGQTALEKGLAANLDNPQELGSFAEGLELVGRLPGAGSYVAPLQPALRIIRQAAAAAEKHAKAVHPPDVEAQAPDPVVAATSAVAERAKTPAAPAAASVVSPFPIPAPDAADRPAAIAPPPQRREPRVQFVVVPGHPKARFCEFPGSGKMTCVHQLVPRPRWIHSVIVSNACPYDVFVASGSGTNSDWVIFAAGGKGTAVSGTSLPVGQGKFLTVGTAQEADDALPGVRCGVTLLWSGLED